MKLRGRGAIRRLQNCCDCGGLVADIRSQTSAICSFAPEVRGNFSCGETTTLVSAAQTSGPNEEKCHLDSTCRFNDSEAPRAKDPIDDT